MVEKDDPETKKDTTKNPFENWKKSKKQTAQMTGFSLFVSLVGVGCLAAIRHEVNYCYGISREFSLSEDVVRTKLSQLEKAGLVEQSDIDPSGQGKDKKIYSLTNFGKAVVDDMIRNCSFYQKCQQWLTQEK